MLKLWKVLRLAPSARSMSSQTQSPTFSSTDSKIVARLGPSNIATMIMSGQPNRPFPDSYQVNLETFSPAALSAVSVITEAMSHQQWDNLEDLVDEGCIEALRNIFQNQTYEENLLVRLKPDDVFFSFVSNAENCKSGNNLNLVTFSLPKLGEVKEMVAQNKNLFDKTNREIETTIKEKKENAKDYIREQMQALKEAIDSNDPHEALKQSNIVIGNYRFERESHSDQWRVTEVAQISSVDAWHPVFRLRWKGRLSIATRGGFDFYKILRIDYTTDWIAFMLILAIL